MMYYICKPLHHVLIQVGFSPIRCFVITQALLGTRSSTAVEARLSNGSCWLVSLHRFACVCRLGDHV